MLLKLQRRLRYRYDASPLPSPLSSPLRHRLPPIRIGNRDQEIRSRLPIHGYVSHVDEVLPGVVRRPEVYHPPFVDEADLVKDVVERFAGLVDGDDSRLVEVVRRNPQGTDEF